jgi:hypothetical protein
MEVQTRNRPYITAKAHPAVITIQPEFSALDFLSETPATTPSPSNTSTAVPMNSPNQGESIRALRLGTVIISHRFRQSANLSSLKIRKAGAITPALSR